MAEKNLKLICQIQAKNINKTDSKWNGKFVQKLIYNIYFYDELNHAHLANQRSILE